MVQNEEQRSRRTGLIIGWSLIGFAAFAKMILAGIVLGWFS